MAIGDTITFPAKEFNIGATVNAATDEVSGGTPLANALVSAQVTISTQLSPSLFTAGAEWQKGNNPTGKKMFSVQVELVLGEFGAGTVYALLLAAMDTLTAFSLKATTSAVGPGNPLWGFNASVPELTPLGDGAIQSNVTSQFTLTASGEVAVDITP